MKPQEARELGDRLAGLVHGRQLAEAHDLLDPVLAARTPFRLLDAIGARLGRESHPALDLFLDQVAARRTMGGWVVIASTLRQQLPRDLSGTLGRCREFVMAADTWYATDTLGERVPGTALVAHFEPALAWIAGWREDPNRWVRRMVGVAVHYWTKRSRGAAQLQPQAGALLDLLAPMFGESDWDAAKGVGWGLKTLGKYYPDLAADWLERQAGRPHRAVMLHKAVTYFPPQLRQRIREKLS